MIASIYEIPPGADGFDCEKIATHRLALAGNLAKFGATH
jgi:hypothetical protein